jgi:hypothetical protein
MAEAEFGVKYDGPALADGRMPVKDLAPALLALGDLFTEASLVAFPDRDPATLNIRATESGSFLVLLGLHSPEAWDQIIQLLSGKTMTALVNLQNLIFAGGGLLWLMKELRGHPIASTERLESGHIRLTLPDGTILEVIPEALALYERQSARKAAREVVEPLHRPGVERLEFGRDDEEVLAIEEDDLPAYELPEPEEEVLLDREEESIVTLVTVPLAEGYKWRFSEGDNVFTASLEDPVFRARIDAGEAFRKGDMLRVRMRVVQTEREGKLHVERAILEVLEHYPRKLQTQIDMELEDGDD